MNILFLNIEEHVEGTVKVISSHVVELRGVEQNLSGFHVLKNGAPYGKYESFTTLYRTVDGGYQLSNDGSVYVEPEPTPEPEPYEPTLEEVQEAKVAEMNAAQQSIINGGCEVELSDGTKEIFPAAYQDQLSLNGLSVNALKKYIESMISGINSEETATQSADLSKLFPWHTVDESKPCEFYSQEDSEKITNTVMAFVVYHITYFRDLRIYIRSLTDKEAVEAITYGAPIPEAYQSEVLKALLATETNGGTTA